MFFRMMLFSIFRNLSLYIASLFLVFSANVASQKQYNWDFEMPLNITPVISGSFGELRGGHFHSGVDFTTQGRTGLPMFSIDEGYVSRIGVSPVGFGKAVYVNHPNGFTSVYAHCEWFSETIEKIVTEIQYQKQSFAIDEHFSAGQIPVKRGELVAYSGNSGSSGGPHLHFEIRETATQRPLNVHHFNLPVKDDVPPHIEAICIYPLGEGSTVNGRNEPLLIPVVKSGSSFVLSGNPTINASGVIGVGVETLDYFTGSWRKCGVYSITLKVDGNQWFESRLDGFLFSHTRYLNSHIDFARRHTTKRVVQKSFLDENNQLDIYTTTAERGRVQMLPCQSRRFNYEIRDAAGNLSELTFIINGAERSSGAKMNAAPQVPLLHPQRAWTTTIEGFRVSFPENSFYTSVPADFSVVDNPGVGLGRHFSILKETVPVHNFFEVTLPIPENLRGRKGLTGARVNSNGNGPLIYASSSVRGGQMVIRTREAGVYCLAIDDTPPIVRLKNAPANRNYSGRDAIRLELRDDFSGVASYRASINGEWMLFEHDPKNNELAGFFRNLRIPRGGRHLLEVVAIDMAGNESVFTTEFVY